MAAEIRHTSEDAEDGDQVQERDGRDGGHHERIDTCNDPDDAHDQHPPGKAVLVRALERRNDANTPSTSAYAPQNRTRIATVAIGSTKVRMPKTIAATPRNTRIHQFFDRKVSIARTLERVGMTRMVDQIPALGNLVPRPRSGTARSHRRRPRHRLLTPRG